MTDTKTLIRLCAADAVGDDEIHKVELQGRAPLAITRHAGRLYVFPDRCPHAEESLSTGWVEDGRIICGVHFAEFELGSGEVHNRPVGCPNMRFFAVEERDGEIFAALG